MNTHKRYSTSTNRITNNTKMSKNIQTNQFILIIINIMMSNRTTINIANPPRNSTKTNSHNRTTKIPKSTKFKTNQVHPNKTKRSLI